MWWALCTISILAAGGAMLWWGWRHVDEMVPVPVTGPYIGLAPCVGAVGAPTAQPEGALAGRLLAGTLDADDYRAEMELLAAADAGNPVSLPD
jgi:hypothetical protein